ncbi:MAG: hypothetical protein JWP74_1741 [Marmoricola sp.]|nr:hypothetical protein [Marmoricola sp.]
MTIDETCSCGATFRLESNVNQATSIGGRHAEAWRKDHRHEFAPMPPQAAPVATCEASRGAMDHGHAGCTAGPQNATNERNEETQ